ncbi:hypothetical protein KUTeg_011948 [Tegillarca granosa]|uniref:Glypican-6 n=1 Tax=Tegillarca granosa TaxID=220873 RepID=A0ABQ9EY53_TEGGR|nr:hypothetical protein KUTeg_011948 [Tegillarca granosa]
MAARLSVNLCLKFCVFALLNVLCHCLSFECLDVKRAYTEKGFSDNDIPIKAISGDHLEVCPQGYTCCTRDMENKLRSLSLKEYNHIVDEAFKYIRSTFVSRTRKFDEFFTELLDKAKNDLHEMFVRTYGLLYKQNSAVFTNLFKDLRSYYKGSDIRLLEALDNFFKTLLKKMFELLNSPHTFNEQYLNCVTSQMDKLKPFGDVPNKLSIQVHRSFIAARTFVQGLAIGRDVIIEVGKIPPTESCTKGLMKMSHCPHCRGLTRTKPCNNLCLNTMKEAMKKLAQRLEGPFNIESVVDPIDVKISDAIMNLQENSPKVKDKIFEGCGRPQTQNMRYSNQRSKRDANITATEQKSDVHLKSGSTSNTKSNAHSKPQADDANIQNSPFVTGNKGAGSSGSNEGGGNYEEYSYGTYKPPSKKKQSVRPTTAAGTSLDRLVRDIKEKVKIAKDFWVQIPYAICNDKEIAAQPDSDGDCWNGHDRAKYVAEVQKDGLISQLNNPEVVVDPNTSPDIIRQQKTQLRIITSKLNNAFHGEEVEWIDTVVSVGYDAYPEGSGVTQEGSGDITDDTEGSWSGSGSGDGSDGDDERIYTHNPNRGRGNKNKNRNEKEDHSFNFVDPTYEVDGSKNERTHVFFQKIFIQYIYISNLDFYFKKKFFLKK